jgi:hypothetical protein
MVRVTRDGMKLHSPLAYGDCFVNIAIVVLAMEAKFQGGSEILEESRKVRVTLRGEPH